MSLISPDGKVLEWDSRHGEVELYNKNGKKHLGAFDPTDGRQLKSPSPGRSIKT